MNTYELTSPSGKTYTNMRNVPKETAILAMYMNENGYGGKIGSKTLSCTDLLKPIKQVIYKLRYPDVYMKDVSSIIRSAKGTAMHKAMSSALSWWNVDEYIYDQRTSKVFNGWKISGEFDIVVDGVIKDLKYTSNFSYKKLKEDMDKIQSFESLSHLEHNHPTYFKYAMQLSIYKWLNPELITKPYGFIIFMLNNGSGFEGYSIDSEIRFTLFPTEVVEEYIKDRILEIDTYLKNDTLPNCTDTQRGLKPAEYKLKRMGKNGAMRTVNGSKFTNYQDFKNFVISKGRVGDIEDVSEAQMVICDSYCPYTNLCNQ